MSSIFRLRYYLRRSGEKQPLLLLQPILNSSEFFLPNSESQRPQLATMPTTQQWYLYQAGGACESIELRKLQPLRSSQLTLQQFSRELRHEGLSQANPKELQEELSHLWQGSVKGIALRQLEQGQILATEGAWLITERSFYSLLPCDNEMWQLLSHCQSEQRIALQEQSTGQNYLGLLAIVQQFLLPEVVAATTQAADQHLLLCRLHLDHRTLISMKQIAESFALQFQRSPQQGISTDSDNSVEMQGYLYSLRFLSGQSKEQGKEKRTLPASQKQCGVPDTNTASRMHDSLVAHGRPLFYPQILFAPVSSVESSQILRSFLRKQIPLLKHNAKDQSLLCQLEEMAGRFIGWGEAAIAESSFEDREKWKILGAWRIKSDLQQRFGNYIYQRACQFGGYAIEKLLRELEGQLPQALLKSLIAYLCGAWQSPATEQNPQEELWNSCAKVDGYLLAKESMHPATRTAHNDSSDSVEAAELATKGLSLEPKHISPQGRQMLQEIRQSGGQGLTLYHFYKEQAEVIQALLRSGWVLRSRQDRAGGGGGRCYARGLEPETLGKSEEAQDNGNLDLVEFRAQNQRKSLEETLVNYKKINLLRQHRDSYSAGKHHSGYKPNSQQDAPQERAREHWQGEYNHQKYDNHRTTQPESRNDQRSNRRKDYRDSSQVLFRNAERQQPRSHRQRALQSSPHQDSPNSPRQQHNTSPNSQNYNCTGRFRSPEQRQRQNTTHGRQQKDEQQYQVRNRSNPLGAKGSRSYNRPRNQRNDYKNGDRGK